MAIDASIYQNIKQTPIDMPNIADSAAKAMSLNQMAMQNRNMQLQTATQQAMRDSYGKNLDPSSGQLNQQGFLSDIGKVNPQAALDYSKQFNSMNKESADAQIAKLDAASKTVSQVMPSMQYLAGLNEDARAKAYPQIMGQLQQQGVPMQNVPKDDQGGYIYDPTFFKQSYAVLNNTSEHLNRVKAQAEIQKTYSDIGKAPAELNALNNGPRSPNAEITSQYQTDAKPLKGSQMAMAQMMDNYKNPSPQGDASLVLNAFKIKFPNAPDVNSLEELTHSQAASDSFKNAAAKALAGGLDQATRDNLMRDGVSTFRANYDSLQGVKDRYTARAQQAKVNDPTLTYEPAMDKTYKQAMDVQDKIGPYVPPSERGGPMASITKAAAKMLGVGSNQAVAQNSDDMSVIPNANASAVKKSAPPPGVPLDSVLMRSPSGKLKWISKSNYGEAIAAGGSVVK